MSSNRSVWCGVVLWTLAWSAALPAAAQTDVVRDELVRSYMREVQRLEETDIEETPDIYAPPPPREALEPPLTVDPMARIRGGAAAKDAAAADQPTADHPADKLELFGADFFRHSAKQFAGATEVPVPADYRLGPGDKVIINLWGRVDKTYHLTVDREGKIFIPEAGALVVWGLSMDQLQKAAQEQLASVYSDFQMNVMLGKLRSLNVFVLGEAKQTGSYTVSSLATFFNVLHQAGGPNQRGSLRRLRLMRSGRVHRTVDLYDMLLEGAGQPRIHLQSNDGIFVPVIGATAAVRGAVKRPAIYELLGGETVADVIELAGGLTADAYQHRVQIERVQPGGDRLVLDVDLGQTASAGQALEDGDQVRVVRVDGVVDDVVTLAGWVKYPGQYGLTPGMRVSDLLRSGDHLRPDSYLPRAVIRRPLADGTYRLIPVNLNVVLGQDARRGALRETSKSWASAADGYLGSGSRSETGLDDEPFYGPHETGETDPMLQPRDELRIYSAEDVGWRYHVSIDGQVKKPGRYELADGMRLSDLLFEAGGLLPDAHQSRAEIVRIADTEPNEVLYADLEKLLGRGDLSEDVRLEKDDAVYIRRQPERLEPEQVTIEGEVQFPGRYSLLEPGESLYSVLRRAGGPTTHAFLEGAVFVRESVVEDMERTGVNDVFMSFRADSTTGIPMQAAPWLNDLEPKFLASGRVAIDLPQLIATGKERYDVALRDGDRLIVPRRPSEVAVTGYVASSGAIHFEPARSVRHYLDQAGGVTPGGDKGGLRVVKANGAVIRAGKGTRVDLGDTIIVPPKQPSQGAGWRWFRDASTTVLSAAAAVFIVTRLD